MELKFKKNETWNKVILIVLCGVLLLVAAMPQKSQTEEDITENSENGQTLSYENRLRTLLSDTYGEGMVDVLIYAGASTQTYYTSSTNAKITGVLITVDGSVVTDTTIADITLSVCALFDLPAHKVAVLVKN